MVIVNLLKAEVRLGVVLGFMLLVGAANAAEPMPELGGNILIHDPSIIATEAGWASFATGVEGAADGGMPRTKSSPDGVIWTETGAIPGGVPAWIKDELRTTPRNIWAPAVSVHDRVATLYYAASSFGTNTSAIGLMTNVAFDATRPAEGWVDRGLVIRSKAGDPFNAIDPFRIDVGETAWLAFGSFWDGIRMIELDPTTGMGKGADKPLRLASRHGDAVEAPALLEHDGRFYLFVSFDACCRGIASTYRIMVGRADAVEGPYFDRDGKRLLDGGGTQLLATTGRFHGPGGQEVFMAGGEPWLAFHSYDLEGGGAPKLQLAPLGFGADGWPEMVRCRSDALEARPSRDHLVSIMTRLLTRFVTFRTELATLWRAFMAPGTPWHLKALMLLVPAYLLSPIDLIPDVVPFLGWADDLIVVPMLVSMIVRMLPQPVRVRTDGSKEIDGSYRRR